MLYFPSGETVHAKTNDEAISLIEQEWDEVWFDYDMGGKFGQLESDYPSTILPVVDHIMMHALLYGCKFPIGIVVVHTANPVGRQQIATTLGQLYRVRHEDARRYTIAIVEPE